MTSAVREVTIDRSHVSLPPVTVIDDRSDTRRGFDERRLSCLVTSSQLPEDAAERHEVLRLSDAAHDAFKDIQLNLRPLVVKIASRSTPFFLALASGHWVRAAELVESTPVPDEDLGLRQKLIVWLRIKTPNGLEDDPTMAKAA